MVLPYYLIIKYKKHLSAVKATAAFKTMKLSVSPFGNVITSVPPPPRPRRHACDLRDDCEGALLAPSGKAQLPVQSG